jgi:uncharacterized protein
VSRQHKTSSANLEQHSILQSIVLHLLPGVLIGAIFFTIAPLVHRLHLPPFIALCIADVIVLPSVLGYLFYLGYKKNGKALLENIVLYRERIPSWQYLVFVPLALIAVGGLFALLSPTGTFLFETFFSWLPTIFIIPGDLSLYSRSTLVVSYLVFIVVIVFTAPIIEEMYFRGYLLPRLSRFGVWVPVINSVLFALFHTWTPWLAVTRAISFLPLFYLVRWKRNIYLGMAAHVLGNSVDAVMGVMFILRHFS